MKFQSLIIVSFLAMFAWARPTPSPDSLVISRGCSCHKVKSPQVGSLFGLDYTGIQTLVWPHPVGDEYICGGTTCPRDLTEVVAKRNI